MRLFYDETTPPPLSAATLLGDIQGFYDAIAPDKAIELALNHGYPPLLVLIEGLSHAAPRVLRERNKFAPAIYPTVSLQHLETCARTPAVRLALSKKIKSMPQVGPTPSKTISSTLWFMNSIALTQSCVSKELRPSHQLHSLEERQTWICSPCDLTAREVASNLAKPCIGFCISHWPEHLTRLGRFTACQLHRCQGF